MTNAQRAAIIAFAQSTFPVLILAGVNLSDTAIAAIMLVITNAVTLIALILPGPKEVVETIVEVPQDSTPPMSFGTSTSAVGGALLSFHSPASTRTLDEHDLLKTLIPLESKSAIKPDIGD